MEKGKLIMTTKSSKSNAYWRTKRIAAVIYGGMGIGMIIFVLSFLDIFKEMSKELLSNEVLGIVIILAVSVGAIIYAVYCFFVNKYQASSYCEVYEKVVCGRTGLSSRHPNEPVRDFEIPISDIVSVTEAGQTVYIQTKYESYDVVAFDHRSDVVKEIRARVGMTESA